LKEDFMKKLFAIALALFFVTATSGLVMADGTAPAPTTKATKHKKKGHKHPKKAAAATTAPADAPAAK
jgi:hypothetical protein